MTPKSDPLIDILCGFQGAIIAELLNSIIAPLGLDFVKGSACVARKVPISSLTYRHLSAHR